MADEAEDLSDQMRQWMEAAQRPQPPLTNTELRQVRALLDSTAKTAWLKKRIYVALPWVTTLLVSLGAGWKWIVSLITGHTT